MESITDVKKAKKRKASVFENHKQEILQLLQLKISIPAVYKIIEPKLVEKRNPKSLYMYLKRNLLVE